MKKIKINIFAVFLIFSGFMPVHVHAAGVNMATPRNGNAKAAVQELIKDMVFVRGGCFKMGDVFGGGRTCERPVHEVCVDDFRIGKYDVTQGQWRAIMGNNPSYSQACGDNCPVERVSWNDVQAFIRRLNRLAGSGKSVYRLPTGAEWEYAARSRGKAWKWAGTNDPGALEDYAWYNADSGGHPHPVGQKKPNALGLYDMSGNVWQWVQDWYGADYYGKSPRKNPAGPTVGKYKVLRGGSWSNGPESLRTVEQSWVEPSWKYFDSFGFRLARSAR